MLTRRRALLVRPPGDLRALAARLEEVFGIGLRSSVRPGEFEFLTRMFHRRHVHEHRRGVVDQKYLDDSGDEEVRLGQRLNETQGDVFRVLGGISKMAQKFDEDFHAIFPGSADDVTSLPSADT